MLRPKKSGVSWRAGRLVSCGVGQIYQVPVPENGVLGNFEPESLGQRWMDNVLTVLSVHVSESV
jgi:hypothetical protein